MKVAIIKYNAGNIQSVEYALQRLGISPILSDQIEELQTADKIIFPGVGEASTAMNYLKNKGLDKLIPQLKQPVLGICLGLQLLCEHSEENDTACMGVFKVKVKKFESESLKVPQIGWNTLQKLSNHLFAGLKEDAFVYFVHSYYAELSEQTIAQSNYCLPFSASLHQHNFYATQFHPEKSSENGSKILENFINLT
ncbi:MAG: imidazole glycerol phosphate synthase subunit HisH [Bacteroidetes bacterium]|nr:MAG: imidazole glycerol phosphate synthase subunit HisH [Bacteroidota bacterium]